MASFVTNVFLVGCDSPPALSSYSLLPPPLVPAGLWALGPCSFSSVYILDAWSHLCFSAVLGKPSFQDRRSSRSGPRLLPWVSLIHLQSCTSQTAVTLLLLLPIWASSRLFKLRPRVTEPGDQRCLSFSDLSVRTHVSPASGELGNTTMRKQTVKSRIDVLWGNRSGLCQGRRRGREPSRETEGTV